MMNKDIYILGIGYNTPLIIELADLNGYTIKGLYNYDLNEVDLNNTLGYPVLGDYSFLYQSKSLDNSCNYALSMGNNKIRKELFERVKNAGGNVPTLVHPTASVSPLAKVSNEGVIIHANSTVQATAVIGSNTIVSYNSGITHTTHIGCHCYIASLTTIGAYCQVDDGVFIGMGSTIVSGKVGRIGSWAYIGAGSLVIAEVPENSLVYGSPARVKPC